MNSKSTDRMSKHSSLSEVRTSLQTGRGTSVIFDDNQTDQDPDILDLDDEDMLDDEEKEFFDNVSWDTDSNEDDIEQDFRTLNDVRVPSRDRNY